MFKACIVCAALTTNRTRRCDQHPKPRSPSSRATSKASHKRARLKLLNKPCHLCGEPIDPKDLHADHVIPVSKGGEHKGLAPAHAWCNLKRGTADANLSSNNRCK